MILSGIKIEDNRTFQRVYKDFYDEYNSGVKAPEIANGFIYENALEMGDVPESHPFWFALALALWETGALNSLVLSIVHDIIVHKKELALWRHREPAVRKKREQALEEFLKKISRRQNRSKSPEPHREVHYTKDLIELVSPDKKRKIVASEAVMHDGDVEVCGELSWQGHSYTIFECHEPIPNLKIRWVNRSNLVIEYNDMVDLGIRNRLVGSSGDKVRIRYVAVEGLS